MKNIEIVSKVVSREGEAKHSPSKDISSANLSDYLLKSIWDKVWEIRTDSQGTEYIFGKLPVVTQYGITMYSGDGVDVPSLASGLPFDGRTIWYNPDTQQIEVIGGTGGGGGEGVSNFWDLSGIPSWITNSKPKYTYSEIEGTPDLTQYATESWVNTKLGGYLPLSGGTLSGSSSYILTINRTNNTPLIAFQQEGSLCGFLGVTKDSNAALYTNNGAMYHLIHTNNIGSYAWTSSNDGSGSGLDADLLDGFHRKSWDGIPSVLSNGVMDIGKYIDFHNAADDALDYATRLECSGAHGNWVYLPSKTGTLALTIDTVASANSVMINYTQSDVDYEVLLTNPKDSWVSGIDALYHSQSKPLTYNASTGLLKVGGDILATGGITTNDSVTINGIKLSKSKDGVLYLDGNLVVKGGVTMYGTDATSSPSILDSLPIASTSSKGIAQFNPSDFAVKDGVVSFVGSVDGGVASSVAWGNITGKPTFATVATSGKYSDLSGLPTIPTIPSSLKNPYSLTINNSGGTAQVTYDGSAAKSLSLTKAMVGLSDVENTALSTWMGTNKITTLGTITSGTWNGSKIVNAYLANSSVTISGESVSLGGSITQSALRSALGLGSNAYTSTAYLPLSGGTLSGNLTIQNTSTDIITLYRASNSGSPSIKFTNKSDGTLGYMGVSDSSRGLQPFFMDTGSSVFKIWHEGNDGSGSGLDADLLDGFHRKSWDGIPSVLSNGVMDIGKYIDFHNAADDALDYATRLECSGAHGNWVYLPSKTGTLALTIDTVASANSVMINYTQSDVDYEVLLTNPKDSWVSGIDALYHSQSKPLTYNASTGLLKVGGDILATGGITLYSMRALKNVVDERGLSLTELSTIKPTRYTWKDGRDNRLHFGGIADDIQQVLPEVVYSTSDGILTMDYGNAAFAVASSLIKPVIDHEKRIAMLEAENKQLRQEVERLKSA